MMNRKTLAILAVGLLSGSMSANATLLGLGLVGLGVSRRKKVG